MTTGMFLTGRKFDACMSTFVPGPPRCSRLARLGANTSGSTKL
jgi:hypothetical protein